jgi:hypothetical protein
MRFSLATRILLAVLVVIVAYFFLVEEKHRKEAVEKHISERELFPFPADSVQKFVLVNPAGQRIAVQRAAGGWQITSPVTAAGEDQTVATFLGQFIPGRRQDEMPDVKDLGAYGLSPPFATIILYLRNAPPDTLYIGDQTPTSSNTYVKLGSSRNVFISSSVTHNLMNKSLYSLRDKTFIPFKSEAVTGIAVRGGKTRLDLVRSGSYWWFADRRTRADRVKIEAYLTQLTGTIIRSFASESDSLQRFGLEHPEREITFSLGAERSTVSFGARKGDDVYAARTGLDKVVSLDAKLLGAFDWTRENLRAMSLAFFDPDSIKVIEYRTPDTSMVMRKAGTHWIAVGRDTIPPARSYVVDALLRKLTNAAFDKILADPVPPNDKRLANPALTIKLEDLLGGIIDAVTIARTPAGTELGTSRSSNALGELRKGTLEDITGVFKRIGREEAPRPSP